MRKECYQCQAGPLFNHVATIVHPSGRISDIGIAYPLMAWNGNGKEVAGLPDMGISPLGGTLAWKILFHPN